MIHPARIFSYAFKGEKFLITFSTLTHDGTLQVLHCSCSQFICQESPRVGVESDRIITYFLSHTSKQQQQDPKLLEVYVVSCQHKATQDETGTTR